MPALNAFALGLVAFAVSAGAQTPVAPKVYVNITSNYGRLTAAWNAWAPPRGSQITGFVVDAVPLNETWAFDEPFSPRTGWIYDDGSSTTNYSSALASMALGNGTLTFGLVGQHGV